MTLPALRREELRTDWTDEQIALVKRTIARGCDDDELALFMHICQRTGLDPFAKQIYAIRRWDSKARREVMTPQTSIDGYRLVAERTGRYAPGREPSHSYDGHGKLLTATSYVKKLTADGTWHEVAATAHYSEYAQTTKEGAPTRFWAQMPHVMLAKVAEALALRRAFPADLSGIYTHEEMAQADTGTDAVASGAAAPAFPEPRRAGARPPAPSAAEVAPRDGDLPEGEVWNVPPGDTDTTSDTSGEPLTLTGELSDEEKYGPFVSKKELASLMAAVDARKITTDALKAFCRERWGVTTRTKLRRGMLPVLGEWMAAGGERQPGEDG